MQSTCYCGQTKAQLVKVLPQAKILQCDFCNLMRTDPSPLAQTAAEFYGKENVSESQSSNIELWKSFSKEILDFIKPYKSKGSFLDIGCNIGVLVNEATLYGYIAQGIDLNVQAISKGKELFNVNLSAAPLEKLEKKFDIIALNHTLEHIHNLRDFFTQLKAHLNPEGLLFVAVPNARGGIPFVLDLLNRKKSGRGSQWFWYGYLPEQHVWQFGPQELSKIFKENGFKIVKCSARQNMHWGATANPGIRFKMMAILWWVFKIFNRGDNLFILAR
ncbi:MAG: class I SAM-dependent methyltransferase [Oligoflexia bacterium]|nr:class I SAM-dependent methyltransferase [Oligoflexia bacterium]